MEEERGGGEEMKKGIVIDWEKALDSACDDDPLERVALPELKRPPSLPRQQSGMGGADQLPQRDEFLERMRDNELSDSIERTKKTLAIMAPKLPDKGEKLRLNLRRLEDEREHRKRRRLETDASGECQKPPQATSSINIGASTGFKEEATAPQTKSPSTFASPFMGKLEENSDCRTASEVHRESSLLPCNNRQKLKSNGDLLPKRGKKGRSPSRYLPRESPRNFYQKGNRSISNGGHNGRPSSIYPLHRLGEKENSSICTKRNDASQVHGLRPRKAPTIVDILDEEEAQPMDTTEQAEELPECMKEATIYYPSRSDPKAVEICSADIKCLDPGGCLSSNIMNFYIRYLQQQASQKDRAMCDCHFFNTFFYKKLKGAVAYKGNDKDENFGKFRKWWKGVNLFQKAYILIPIHDDEHWSLVIICIPDKEEDSGPIVLHLDSLGGVHSAESVFRNIKSYLKEEWNFLDQEVALSDLPISDRIWKQLPQKIQEKKPEVPQQRNEYDCGLFVLFFMERFLEEVPPRLKKTDLAMFSKRWFKPEEASRLRMKIQKLLGQEFRDACEVNCSKDSPPEAGGTSEERIGPRES